ncbi:MAG: LysM peptidoglycan-binding domain-containing protein, partial [Mariprofundaceae bacterium]
MKRPLSDFLPASHAFFSVFIATLMLLTIPTAAHAAANTAKEGATQTTTPALVLRAGVTQPYIVKKGDTLWDIANYFFKQPDKWLKIWERNLYITNPDLIYPGNKIWFNAKVVKKSGGLSSTRLQPQLRIKPVERLEASVDTSIVLTALQRQDFIRPEAVQAAGYVLDSRDERINYGANDRIYLKFAAPVEVGSVFDVFRSTDPVRDPENGELAGMLVKHLGQVRILANREGISEARVIRAFEEISRGDRVKPVRSIQTRITPDYPQQPLAGRIMYIRNHAAEAG